MKRGPCLACLQFLSLDLRNGSLRKKYDALKYTLKKMEVGTPTLPHAAESLEMWCWPAGVAGM